MNAHRSRSPSDESDSPPDASVSAVPARPTATRLDPPAIAPTALWNALSRTPGVGLSIIDREGQLLFVNELTGALFHVEVSDYQGKTLADFHPPEFVHERLSMIRRCLDENRPLGIQHIYHGNPIVSVLWPIRDSQPPHGRVIVVSHVRTEAAPIDPAAAGYEIVSTDFIGLGPLDVLTERELEVLAILGHGLNVPEVARMLHRSPKTIERHKDSISRKLMLRGQSEIVELVTRMGLEISDAKRKRFSAR